MHNRHHIAHPTHDLWVILFRELVDRVIRKPLCISNISNCVIDLGVEESISHQYSDIIWKVMHPFTTTELKTYSYEISHSHFLWHFPSTHRQMILYWKFCKKFHIKFHKKSFIECYEQNFSMKIVIWTFHMKSYETLVKELSEWIHTKCGMKFFMKLYS